MNCMKSHATELKRNLMSTEFQFQMQIKGVEQSGLDQREKNREKAKDNRIDFAFVRIFIFSPLKIEIADDSSESIKFAFKFRIGELIKKY